MLPKVKNCVVSPSILPRFPRGRRIFVANLLHKWKIAHKYVPRHNLSCSIMSHLLLQLLNRHIISVLPNNCIRYLPNLYEVIFCRATEHPRIVQIPAKVRYAVRVAAVHEESSVL